MSDWSWRRSEKACGVQAPLGREGGLQLEGREERESLRCTGCLTWVRHMGRGPYHLMIPLPRSLNLPARAHVYLTDHYHLNFIRRRRRGAEEVIIGGNAPRAVSKAVVLTAAEREHGDSSLLFSFFLFCCSVSQPAGTALHYCLLEAGATRERESAAAACEVYSRSCQSGSGTTVGAGIGVWRLFPRWLFATWRTIFCTHVA